VNKLLFADLNGHIKRTLPDSSFNFDFFIKAFSSNNPDKKTETDTSASKWKIVAEDLELDNIRADFSDDMSGLDMKAMLGSLKLSMRNMDLNDPLFDVKKIFISDASVSINLKKTSATETAPAPADRAVSKMPLLAANEVNLERVQFYFADQASGISLGFN